MKKPISKDLKEIAEIMQSHLLSIGLDQESSLKETLEMAKKIGSRFNGDYAYIAYNNKKMDEIKKVSELVGKNYGVRDIAARTGIHPSSVRRIIKGL